MGKNAFKRSNPCRLCVLRHASSQDYNLLQGLFQQLNFCSYSCHLISCVLCITFSWNRRYYKKMFMSYSINHKAKFPQKSCILSQARLVWWQADQLFSWNSHGVQWHSGGGLPLLTEKEAVSLQLAMSCTAVLLSTLHVAHVPRGTCWKMEGSRR